MQLQNYSYVHVLRLRLRLRSVRDERNGEMFASAKVRAVAARRTYLISIRKRMHQCTLNSVHETVEQLNCTCTLY